MSWTQSCLFCLESVDPATCSEIVLKNPKNVEIKPLLHYLTGVDPSSHGESPCSRIPVMTQLPTLCLPCYEKLGQLHQLHQNLLEIQRLIQHVALEMRRTVRECGIVADGKRKSKLDTFLYKLRKVSQTESDIFPGSTITLKDLHDLITGEGSNDVIFPSRWRPAPSSEASAPTPQTETDSLMTFIEQNISMEGGHYDHLKQIGNFIKAEHLASTDENDDNYDHDDSLSEFVEDMVGRDLSDNNDADLGFEATRKIKSCSKKETEPKKRKSGRVTMTTPKKEESDESDISSDGDDEEWEFARKGSKKKSRLEPVEPKKKSKRRKKFEAEAKYACQYCDKSYVDHSGRCRHYRHSHAEQYAAELLRKQTVKCFPYSLSSKPDKAAAQLCPMCTTKDKVVWVELSNMGLHMEAHLGDGRQGWKCQVCHEVYPTRSMILDHIEKNPECSKSNTNDFVKHICTLCQPQQNELETEMDLFHHIFDVHEKDESLEKLHKCQGCDSEYRTELGLDFHVNRHVKMRRWRKLVDKGRVPCPKDDEAILQKCKFCDEMIPRVEIKIHLTTEHTDRIEEFVFIKCKLCSDELVDFGDREEYQKHLHRRHNQPNIQKPCDLCEFDASDRPSELRKHYFHIHQIGSNYVCEHCSATLYTEESLKTHLRKYHSETEGKFPCEFCLKYGDTLNGYLSSKLSLEQHLAKVHPVDRYKCERLQCIAQFRCKGDFIEHEKMDHQDDPLLICPDASCSKEFVHAISLKNHVKMIHEGKRQSRTCVIMKCSVCDKTFRTVSHLKRHEAIHSEETFQCDQCPKSFKLVASFRKHQLTTHLPGGRPRPFVCEVCSRAFYNAKLLEQHARIHTGERPFPCQFCGMAFRHKSSLRTHELGHKNKQENFRSTGTFDRGPKGN